eukprot:m.72864 g.72864  ORF g.72864 m.72864 type:complete len:482 (-) comp13872_c1_seq1:533-1978(-)
MSVVKKPEPYCTVVVSFDGQDESAIEAATQLKQQLALKNISALLVDGSDNPDDPDSSSNRALTACKLVVIIGTLSYGMPCDLRFSSAKQLTTILDKEKHFLLVQRCEWFDGKLARITFDENRLEARVRWEADVAGVPDMVMDAIEALLDEKVKDHSAEQSQQATGNDSGQFNLFARDAVVPQNSRYQDKKMMSAFLFLGFAVLGAAVVLEPFPYRSPAAPPAFPSPSPSPSPAPSLHNIRITLSSFEQRDVGEVINQAFSEGYNDVHLVLSNDQGVYTWNTVARMPHNSVLQIVGSGSQHKKVVKSGGAGQKDDQKRCPVRILMDQSHLVYPDRTPGQSYYNYTIYHRLVISPHSRATIQGVTISEKISIDTSLNPVYQQGIITLTAPFSSVIVRDSRVEFGQHIFVNSHSAGRTAVNFGHVRFVGTSASTTSGLYAVFADPGQSWLGNICEVSVSGGSLEDGAKLPVAGKTSTHSQVIFL